MIWWPFASKSEDSMSQRLYLRRVASLKRAEREFERIVDSHVNSIQEAQKEIKEQRDSVQYEIEQVEALLRQYRKQCDTLTDERDVLANTIKTMQASHTAMTERWRAEAAVHSITRTLQQGAQGE